MEASQKLRREDLTENIVIIKINKLYNSEMSALELYETTRGAWKRKLESVSRAEYCLAVANGVVVEVYKISAWHKAGTTSMQTRTIEATHLDGRIEFDGEVAEEAIREKYLGKSTANLYKSGEADPVKVFLKDALSVQKSTDINIPTAPLMVIATEDVPILICPKCEYDFSFAPRCPECGQLIASRKEKWNKPKLKSLAEWEEKAHIEGAKPSEVISFVNKAILDKRISYHMGAVDLSLDYKDTTSGLILKMLLLFGKERCGAIQPSAFYIFANRCGIKEELIGRFLEEIRPYLSDDQKNTPYERLNGYYFIDYCTLIEKQDEILAVYHNLLTTLEGKGNE